MIRVFEDDNKAECSNCGIVELKYNGGPRPVCPIRLAESARKRYEENKNNPLTKHGLTRKEVRALIEDKICELCGVDSPLVPDHSHKTGELRGILCSNCNLKLGRLERNVDWYKRAIAYAEKGQ